MLFDVCRARHRGSCLFDAFFASSGLTLKPFLPHSGQADSQEAATHQTGTAHRAEPQTAAQPTAQNEQQGASLQQNYPHASAGLDLPGLPDAIATWHDQRGLQILWMLSSIFMILLDFFGLDVGFLPGLLGIIGSSLAVCNCFQGMDFRSIVKVRCFVVAPYCCYNLTQAF